MVRIAVLYQIIIISIMEKLYVCQIQWEKLLSRDLLWGNFLYLIFHEQQKYSIQKLT